MNKYLEIEDILKLSKTNLNNEIDVCPHPETVQIETPKSKLNQINVAFIVIVLIVGSVLIYHYTKKQKEEKNKTP
jgi:hypothetical protein